MASITLEELLAPARYARKVDIPSVQGDVYMRPMSGRDRERIAKYDDDIECGKEMIRLSVCDEKGKLLFSEAKEIDDLPAIVFDEMAAAAMKINRFGTDAVEQAEKNSEVTRGDFIGLPLQDGSECLSPALSES